MNTLEVVEATRLKTASLSEHLGRLAGLTSNSSYAPKTALPFYQEALVRRWQALGYTWFVGVDFVKRFTYAAEVAAMPQLGHDPTALQWGLATDIREGQSRAMRHDIRFPAVVVKQGKQLRYRGDLPDVVIDRAIQALADGFACLTVHSNDPLPVEEINLKGVDPVLIGWHINPGIHWSQERWSCDGSAIGAVLAIWDENGNPTELS